MDVCFVDTRYPFVVLMEGRDQRTVFAYNGRQLYRQLTNLKALTTQREVP